MDIGIQFLQQSICAHLLIISVSINVDTPDQIKDLELKYSKALPEVKESISKHIECGPLADKIKRANRI